MFEIFLFFLVFPGVRLELEFEQHRVIFILDLVKEEILIILIVEIYLFLFWKTRWDLISLMLLLMCCWCHWINGKTALFQNGIARNAVILIFCTSENIWFIDLAKYIWEINGVIIWNLFGFLVSSFGWLVLSWLRLLQESFFVERWSRSIGIDEHILFLIIHIDNFIGFFNGIYEIVLLFISLSEVGIISQKVVFAIFFDGQSQFFWKWNIELNCLILVLLLPI